MDAFAGGATVADDQDLQPDGRRAPTTGSRRSGSSASSTSSLERLGVDHVELYLAHDYDPDVPLDETIGALEELKRAGRIRAYGVSNFDASQLEAALSAGAPGGDPELLLAAGAGRRGRSAAAVCRARELAYLAFSPLAGGWLTGKYRRGQPFPAGSRMTQRPEPYQRLTGEATFDALERLEAIAGERGTSMAGTALAWLLADERVTQVVTGPGRAEHLTPIREALQRPLTHRRV